MAPDRRFGLPHPLDADPSEDSSPRKPGLWESFKRALGNPPPEASSLNDLPDPSLPASTLPKAPQQQSPSGLPASVVPAPPAQVTAPRVLEAIDFDVPFLENTQAEPGPLSAGPVSRPGRPSTSEGASEVSPPPEPVSAPAEASSEPPAGAPKLARGLASFSRRNAEREKKFAHLLRDGAPAGPKPRPRGKRG